MRRKNERKAALRIVALLVLFQPIISLAGDITFSSNGTITDGNIYDNVYVENDGTVVDMTGGQISSLFMYDLSIFNLYDGLISGSFGGIDISSLSTINVLGGTIDKSGHFVVHGNANFTSGDINFGGLKTYEDSLVTVTGGSLNFGYFDIHGSVDIMKGDITVDNTGFDTSSIVNIYSINYNYNSNDGILTAYLIDGGYLSMAGLEQSAYDRLNFIPEPASLFMLALGGLLFRKHR
jgi:hypothetical protein